MKTIKLILILLLISILYSCDSESQTIPSVEKKAIKSIIPEQLQGIYRAKPTDINPGTVTIYPDRVIITTIKLNIDLNLNKLKYEIKPDCWIYIYFTDGNHKIKIAFFSNGTITVDAMEYDETEIYYDDPRQLGSFSKFIEEENQEENQEEPITNIPVFN
jgi:hypothetical protein